jgi:hypothetical protein
MPNSQTYRAKHSVHKNEDRRKDNRQKKKPGKEEKSTRRNPQKEINVCSSPLGLIKMDHRHKYERIKD